jgi:hypothetical protein
MRIWHHALSIKLTCRIGGCLVHRATDNELQEETLFRVIHTLSTPLTQKNGNFVALQKMKNH